MARGDLTRLDMLVNVRFPGSRAHGIQVAAMATALADAGLAVEVLAPRRVPQADLDPWQHYGVRRNFLVQHLANLDLIDLMPPRLQRVPFLLQSLSFGMRALTRVVSERSSGVLVRDHYTTALLAASLREHDLARLAAEVHNLPAPGRRRRRAVRALSKLPAVITISDGLRDDLLAEGLPGERVLVARDGVDLARFGELPSREAARAELQLPVDQPLVVYAGQLYAWKGVDVLVEAMQHVPDAGLLIVGGSPDELPRVEAAAARCVPERSRLTGQVPPSHVPFYLAAADVIALPNSGTSEISARYTSPLKLFEGMASERALIASNLPSLGEVLTHDHNAWMVAPDDPAALAEGLRTLLGDASLRERLATRARRDVNDYTWTARGAHVARFLRERLTVGAH
ncbi:MAG: hypothetical protein DHS20C15_21490 [Planctomycetota bacterium]|nr:MAG: hypothetical protein DHS20C15_21490 [Planctomycetota bacterium]